MNSLVIGISINLSNTSFPEELENIATSIKKETNIEVNRNDLIVEIINTFDYYNHNHIEFIELYKKHSNVLYQEITVFQNNKTCPSYVKDILSDGSLLIIKENEEIILNSAEITIRKS